MNNISAIKYAVLGVAFLLFPASGYALGVSPAVVCISGVELGEDYDTGIDYIISNDSDSEAEFSLEIIAPIMPSDESFKGYRKLPDLAWISVSEANLIISKKSTKTSRIHIKIPKEEKYYNQHWAVSCHVVQKGKGFVNVAVAPFIMIETKVKAELTEYPYGEFGVSPGMIGVLSDKSESKKASFRVYNNSKKDGVYKIKSFIPDSNSKNVKIGPTEGFEWVSNAKWIKPGIDNLKVNEGGNVKVELNINLPKDLKIREGLKGLEGLIFVESDSKVIGFVRVLIAR